MPNSREVRQPQSIPESHIATTAVPENCSTVYPRLRHCYQRIAYRMHCSSEQLELLRKATDAATPASLSMRAVREDISLYVLYWAFAFSAKLWL